MKYFINLTAGLLQNQYQGEFIRIQSSHLESHAFDRLFYSLSDALLYSLAKNEECCIVDCSSNNIGKVIKRAIPIIQSILHYRWFNRITNEIEYKYLARILDKLSSETKRKLDYYKKFNPQFPIKLTGISIKVEKEVYESSYC
jgi:hypothetical protein